MRRRVVRILPDARTGGWRVTGAEGGPQQWATKRAAVAYMAMRLRTAWRERGELGQLQVRLRNGLIEFERTYGRDPRRSKG